MSVHQEVLKFSTKNVPNAQQSVLLVGTDVQPYADSLNGKATVAGRSDPEINFNCYKEGQFDAVLANNVVKLWGLTGPERLETFLKNILRILKPNGTLFVRLDLSYTESGMPWYTNCFDVYRVPEGTDHLLGFKLHWLRGLDASVKASKNWRDFLWCLEKTSFPHDNLKDTDVVTLRDFLDKSQYSSHGIQAYEYIFGEGFISPGGIDENRKFLTQLSPKSGDLMLDVGCGIGGSPFQVSKEFGANVLGMDLSSNMLNVAINRVNSAKDERVRFMLADIMECDFPENYFDSIYSRDAIIHLDDTKKLFGLFFKWLKPGGKVMTVNYALGPATTTTEKFQNYLKARQYSLKTIPQFQEALTATGFTQVAVTDLAKRLDEIILHEIDNAEKNKEEFLKRFTEDQYNKLLSGWRDKTEYIEAGNFGWVTTFGVKPS